MTVSRPKSPVVQLLPGFDEYILGYTDRSPVLDPRHTKTIYGGLNLLFSPTIVIDGRIEGTWKRVIRKEAVDLTLNPFKKWGEAEAHALRGAIQRYGEFLRMRASSKA